MYFKSAFWQAFFAWKERGYRHFIRNIAENSNLSNKIVYDTVTVTLKGDWAPVFKSGYTLISAKSLRPDTSYHVTGFSYNGSSHIIYFSESNTGAQLDVQVVWLKI